MSIDGFASDRTLSNLKVEIDECNERITELKSVDLLVLGNVCRKWVGKPRRLTDWWVRFWSWSPNPTCPSPNCTCSNCPERSLSTTFIPSCSASWNTPISCIWFGWLWPQPFRHWIGSQKILEVSAHPWLVRSLWIPGEANFFACLGQTDELLGHPV